MNASLLPIRDLWDFSQPAVSETRFREQIAIATEAGDAEAELQLATQLARTFSLRRDTATAHTLLDGVEARLDEGSDVVAARYFLERGRTSRTGGDEPASRRSFERAFEAAEAAGDDYLQIDAAHMLAITGEGELGRAWHLRALELTAQTDDPSARSWRGSLLNNLGWAQFEEGDLRRALATFEECRSFMEASEKANGERIARYSIVRTLRAMGELDRALEIAEKLEVDSAAEPDGFVFEELAELWLAKHDLGKAHRYFALAAALLADSYLANSEPDRLNRLNRLAE